MCGEVDVERDDMLGNKVVAAAAAEASGVAPASAGAALST